LFYKSARILGSENENYIKHISKDKILSEILIEITGGNISIYKSRGKIITSYLFCVIRDAFKK
jgi:hypothetical protein